MKTQDIKNIASAYKQVLEKKLDAVNPDELKGTHAQRKDKDIDNDGDVDKSDEYLHNRRKAIKTAMKKEEVEELDELSKKTLGSYVKKAAGDAVTKAYKAGDVRDKDSGKNYMKALGRQIGISKATSKLAKEEVELDEADMKAQQRALQSVKAQPKDKVSVKPAPWDKKKDDKMNESRWPILQRIMERQNHGNMDNGSPRGEGLSPSAKAELARTEGDSGIDGAKAAADTARNAVAQVKVAPKRPNDQTIGDKTMPKNDGK